MIRIGWLVLKDCIILFDMVWQMGGNGFWEQGLITGHIRQIQVAMEMAILAQIMMEVQARQIRVDQGVATIDMQGCYMWMCGLIIWLLLIGNVVVLSFVDWSMNNGDIRRVAAMFAGCFAPDIMGVRLPECFMVFYDSVPLACLVGVSICFLGWKTRYAELFAGIFFVLSIATWLGRGAAVIIMQGYR